MMTESLVSWRSLTEDSEIINNQQKCFFKIMFLLIGLFTIVAIICFLISRNII
jgi:hypothetical protein